MAVAPSDGTQNAFDFVFVMHRAEPLKLHQTHIVRKVVKMET